MGVLHLKRDERSKNELDLMRCIIKAYVSKFPSMFDIEDEEEMDVGGERCWGPSGTVKYTALSTEQQEMIDKMVKSSNDMKNQKARDKIIRARNRVGWVDAASKVEVAMEHGWVEDRMEDFDEVIEKMKKVTVVPDTGASVSGSTARLEEREVIVLDDSDSDTEVVSAVDDDEMGNFVELFNYGGKKDTKGEEKVRGVEEDGVLVLGSDEEVDYDTDTSMKEDNCETKISTKSKDSGMTDESRKSKHSSDDSSIDSQNAKKQNNTQSQPKKKKVEVFRHAGVIMEFEEWSGDTEVENNYDAMRRESDEEELIGMNITTDGEKEDLRKKYGKID